MFDVSVEWYYAIYYCVVDGHGLAGEGRDIVEWFTLWLNFSIVALSCIGFLGEIFSHKTLYYSKYEVKRPYLRFN